MYRKIFEQTQIYTPQRCTLESAQRPPDMGVTQICRRKEQMTWTAAIRTAEPPNNADNRIEFA